MTLFSGLRLFTSLYDLVMKRSTVYTIVISNWGLRNLSVCSSSTRWRCPHQRTWTAIRCRLEFNLYTKNCRSATHRKNWFVTEIWRLVIRHADTLICLPWYVLVLTLRLSVYTVFRKSKIKFGQNFFASPKVGTPVRTWWRHKLGCILAFLAQITWPRASIP